MTESDPEPDDSQWLAEVGRRGWVILSKDQRIHQRQIEIAALLSSGAASFILTSAGTSGTDNAIAFTRAMPTIRQFLDKFERPFVATVTGAGVVKMLLTFADLIKKIE